MEKFFPIGKTAKMVGMTTETLRHYDRIGLVHPCQIDKWTGYRYYSEQEVVRLHTVHALRCMGLSLHKIKKVLEFKDIENIVAFLKQAEQNADKKIAELKEAKTRIQRAEQYYKSKTTEQPKEEVVFQQLLLTAAVLEHAAIVRHDDETIHLGVFDVFDFLGDFFQRLDDQLITVKVQYRIRYLAIIIPCAKFDDPVIEVKIESFTGNHATDDVHRIDRDGTQDS